MDLKLCIYALSVRNQNARKLAKKCQSLQAIDEVLYSGQTGMLSLRLNKAYSVAKLLENLDICIFAESLGGTETLVTFPYTQTHVDMPDAEKINVALMSI